MGRPKGSTNKPKAALLHRLQEIYGKDFDPVMKMAEQAVKLDTLAEEEPSVANQKETITAWGKIAEYVTPKLKSTELTMDNGVTVSIQRKRFTPDTDKKDQ